MQVKLIGKTKKGRERIKQHGEIWTVEQTMRTNLTNHLLLVAADGDWRWVFEHGDLNFEVVTP